MKPIVDGLAAGEQWQYLGQGWRDIRSGDHLLLEDARRYRRKPEPRRFFVRVFDDGELGFAWTPAEVVAGEAVVREGSTLVETVEVLK